MRTKQTFMYGLIAVVLAFTALSLTGCPEPDPGDKLKTLSGTITISPNSDVTVGTELTATYTGTEAVTYQWKQGAANDGTNSDKHTPAAAGSYTVTVSATGYHSKTSDPVAVTVPNPLTGITAVYDSNNPIFPDTTLHTLKDGLTVTATYSDSTTKTLELEDYTLSGTLAQGSSVITVSYTEDGITKTDTFTVTVNAAHAHIWGNWEETTPPTCTEPGEDKRNCTANPPHSETRTGTAALGHDEGEWHVTLDATCEETGTKELRCTRDQFVLQANVTVDALGHDWNDWGTPIPITATVTEDSIETRICKHDGTHKETRIYEYATGTARLAYELITTGSNANTYRVSKGTLTGSNSIYIPSYWRGDSTDYADYKPVTEIGSTSDDSNSGAFISASIVAVYIPASITSIGGYAFSYCTGNNVVTFAEGSRLATIGDNAFSQCNFTSIEIPEGVTSIGSSAFSSCTSLASITIPAGVTSIGNNTFYNCTSLASITIPEGVTSIDIYAFFRCSSLASITIPEGVTSIGYEAFNYCSALTSVTIPASVTSIGTRPFSNCTNLTSITVDAGNQNYISQDNILYNKTQSEIVAAALKGISNVTILEGVTYIDHDVFTDSTSLTGITFPSSLTHINSGAFSGCTSLTEIIIPTSVTEIGSSAFNYWTSSQTIYVTGHASQSAADAAWNMWRSGCQATIKYWNGSSYQ